eukprot:jgi/Pico_ML_1/52334/g3052.t1
MLGTGDKGLENALRVAETNHKDKEVQKTGMCRDSSWDQAAAEYEKVFDWALTDGAYCS